MNQLDSIDASDEEGFYREYRYIRPVVVRNALERLPQDSSVFSLDSIALRHGMVDIASYDLAPHSARASARKLDFYKWSDHDLQDAPLTRHTTAEFIEGLLAGGRSYCTVNETQNTTLFEALEKDVGLAALYPLLGVEQSSYSVLFWIGSEGTGPGLHWDSDKEQILYQCTGRKRVTCFSPEDIARLYPAGSFFHPHGHVSQISDCSSVDHERFPRFVDAVPFECQLEPGDALYLPPFWIHDPSACGPSLSFTLRNVPGDGAWGQSSRERVRTALQGLYNELRQLDPHLAGAYAAVAAHDLSTGLAMADTQPAESAAGAGSDD